MPRGFYRVGAAALAVSATVVFFAVPGKPFYDEQERDPETAAREVSAQRVVIEQRFEAAQEQQRRQHLQLLERQKTAEEAVARLRADAAAASGTRLRVSDAPNKVRFTGGHWGVWERIMWGVLIAAVLGILALGIRIVRSVRSGRR